MTNPVDPKDPKDPVAGSKGRDPRAQARNLAREGPTGCDAGTAQADRQPQHGPKATRHLARPQPGIACCDRGSPNADQHFARTGDGNRDVVDDNRLGAGIGGGTGKFQWKYPLGRSARRRT